MMKPGAQLRVFSAMKVKEEWESSCVFPDVSKQIFLSCVVDVFVSRDICDVYIFEKEPVSQSWPLNDFSACAELHEKWIIT